MIWRGSATVGTTRSRRRRPGKAPHPIVVSVKQRTDDRLRFQPAAGTVWPFDNSFIAWGLRRYGYRQQAAQIASDMFAAARYFDGRLPEAFSGYERARTRYPVQYPTACSPQAWSTGCRP